jgi:hypothetical protein
MKRGVFPPAIKTPVSRLPSPVSRLQSPDLPKNQKRCGSFARIRGDSSTAHWKVTRSTRTQSSRLRKVTWQNSCACDENRLNTSRNGAQKHAGWNIAPRTMDGVTCGAGRRPTISPAPFPSPDTSPRDFPRPARPFPLQTLPHQCVTSTLPAPRSIRGRAWPRG